MPRMKRKNRGQSGFTLVETLVAMLIFVVGVLAVSVLIVYGVRLQAFSRDATQANAHARALIEQLRVITPRPAPGGSLVIDVPNYSDTTPLNPAPGTLIFIRRWVVAPGPAGTLDVTVAVVPSDPNRQLPPVQIRMRM